MTILAFSVGAVVGCVVGVVVMALLAVSREQEGSVRRQREALDRIGKILEEHPGMEIHRGSWDGTLRLIHPGKKQQQTENGD